jgi:hypothetical protein
MITYSLSLKSIEPDANAFDPICIATWSGSDKAIWNILTTEFYEHVKKSWHKIHKWVSLRYTVQSSAAPCSSDLLFAPLYMSSPRSMRQSTSILLYFFLLIVIDSKSKRSLASASISAIMGDRYSTSYNYTSLAFFWSPHATFDD